MMDVDHCVASENGVSVFCFFRSLVSHSLQIYVDCSKLISHQRSCRLRGCSPPGGAVSQRLMVIRWTSLSSSLIDDTSLVALLFHHRLSYICLGNNELCPHGTTAY